MKNKIFIIALASVSLLSSIRGMKTRNGEFTKEHFGTRQPKGLQKWKKSIDSQKSETRQSTRKKSRAFKRRSRPTRTRQQKWTKKSHVGTVTKILKRPSTAPAPVQNKQADSIPKSHSQPELTKDPIVTHHAMPAYSTPNYSASTIVDEKYLPNYSQPGFTPFHTQQFVPTRSTSQPPTSRLRMSHSGFVSPRSISQPPLERNRSGEDDLNIDDIINEGYQNFHGKKDVDSELRSINIADDNYLPYYSHPDSTLSHMQQFVPTRSMSQPPLERNYSGEFEELSFEELFRKINKVVFGNQ